LQQAIQDVCVGREPQPLETINARIEEHSLVPAPAPMDPPISLQAEAVDPFGVGELIQRSVFDRN